MARRYVSKAERARRWPVKAEASLFDAVRVPLAPTLSAEDVISATVDSLRAVRRDLVTVQYAAAYEVLMPTLVHPPVGLDRGPDGDLWLPISEHAWCDLGGRVYRQCACGAITRTGGRHARRAHGA